MASEQQVAPVPATESEQVAQNTVPAAIEPEEEVGIMQNPSLGLT